MEKAVEPTIAFEYAERTGNKIYSSNIFHREKYDDNTFLKLKSRLVGGGHEQSRDSYKESFAPTVDNSTLFLILSLNKYLKGNIAAVDIPMAYLNAPMEETVSYIFALKRCCGHICNT